MLILEKSRLVGTLQCPELCQMHYENLYWEMNAVSIDLWEDLLTHVPWHSDYSEDQLPQRLVCLYHPPSSESPLPICFRIFSTISSHCQKGYKKACLLNGRYQASTWNLCIEVICHVWKSSALQGILCSSQCTHSNAYRAEVASTHLRMEGFAERNFIKTLANVTLDHDLLLLCQLSKAS